MTWALMVVAAFSLLPLAGGSAPRRHLGRWRRNDAGGGAQQGPAARLAKG